MKAPGVICCRPVTDEDQVFLYTVYTGTRPDIVGMELDSELQTSILQMQFAAQTRAYRAGFPNAVDHVIMLSNVPVGRLYVNRPGDEIHIIDIALLPEFRGRQIGSRVMAGIFDEASVANLAVNLMVARGNIAALTWYEGLGFKKIEDSQTHIRMTWKST